MIDNLKLKVTELYAAANNVPIKNDWGEELYRFIQENKDAFFTVIRPGGNNGDELIYKGLNKKLNDTNIKYKEIEYVGSIFSKLNFLFKTNFAEIKIDKKTDIILIQGGGNFNDIWNHGTKLFRNLISNYNIPIVIAPQTLFFYKTNFLDILKKCKQDIYIFCREEISYKYLEKMRLSRNIHIFLSDDTAFYLSKDDFFNFEEYDSENEYILLCIRNDKESNSPEIDKLRYILNDLNIQIFCDDIAVKYSFDEYVKIIKSAKMVVTDRMHVGILSSILERPTLLLPNSYFKNRAVYEFSLRHFPYTFFAE